MITAKDACIFTRWTQAQEENIATTSVIMAIHAVARLERDERKSTL